MSFEALAKGNPKVGMKQDAYERQEALTGDALLEEQISRKMYRYLTEDLGRDPGWSKQRADSEAGGTHAKRIIDDLERMGIALRGRLVLELGAGMGGVTEELGRRGAKVVGLEPGDGWRAIAGQRCRRQPGCFVAGGVGEALPFPERTFDLVVSFQVLEHVRNPDLVVREIFRVLKPGGELFFTYENYLGFREPHYGIFWLPLLPRLIGSWYLRLLGRDPSFFEQAVTYTTFPSVRRSLLRAGFECKRQERWRRALFSPIRTGALKRLLSTMRGREGGLALRLVSAGDYLNRMFRTLTEEHMRRP